MPLGRVQVTDFRCLHSVSIEFDSKFTLISGPNASGKTSLLEALYVLGRGRSFRTRRLDHLVRRGAPHFVVFGEVVGPNGRFPLGVEGASGGLKARIAGQTPPSLAELALRLPVQIIDPEVHRLIEEGPGHRRRFLDWGVFHVEQDFVGHWQRYNQVLKQRNAALKTLDGGVIAAWDADLVRFGELISAARSRYVGVLAARAEAIGRNLLGLELALAYRPGWNKDVSFEEALKLSRGHDQDMGATQVGPHRAELAIRLDGSPARDRISRGQQKLLAAALLLAQVNLFPDESPVRPTLLLDDPAAELDAERLERLIGEVAGQPLQMIITTLLPDFTAFGFPGRRYEVKSGQLTDV
jgi:DNA replication and repair protein RecF